MWADYDAKGAGRLEWRFRVTIFPDKRKLFGFGGRLTFFLGFFRRPLPLVSGSPLLLGNLFVDQQNQTNELLNVDAGKKFVELCEIRTTNLVLYL